MLDKLYLSERVFSLGPDILLFLFIFCFTTATALIFTSSSLANVSIRTSLWARRLIGRPWETDMLIDLKGACSLSWTQNPLRDPSPALPIRCEWT